MALFLIALLAGILTVLSPCVLPLLPIIVGGSLAGGTSLRRTLTVTASLGVSVFLFTILLKVSTAFINVPPMFWTILSGAIIIVVGLSMLFPKLWDLLPFVAKMNAQSSLAMNSGFKRQNMLGDIIVGASLGPVFSTCSPTYFIVLATVLPVSLSAGLSDILAYIAGLCFSLLLISVVGQKVMQRLDIAADPNGKFKRIIGAIFILIGVAILFGLDKIIEAPLYSIFDETKIEQGLLAHDVPSKAMPATGSEASTTDASSTSMTSTTTPGAVGGTVAPASAATLALKAIKYQKAPELVSPDGYLNTGGKPITLAQYRGKDVVLLDFWTYSCINCQRTLPYLTSWYAKYKDQGLVIIGVHTPEFAFEHVQANVAAALKQYGITYPVVLDNEYNTWNAYGNQFWPHEYVIDIDGYITHDHAGEGDYDVTEKAIQAALAERATRMGEATAPIKDMSLTTVADPDLSAVQSPETYFGAERNTYLGNGTHGQEGSLSFTIPSGTLQDNTLYLGGMWDVESEYASTITAGDSIEYTYDAHNLYFVAAGGSKPVTIEVFRDGVPVGANAGDDVDPKTSMATISSNRLYSLIKDTTPGKHTVLIKVMGSGLQAYTFTFG